MMKKGIAAISGASLRPDAETLALEKSPIHLE